MSNTLIFLAGALAGGISILIIIHFAEKAPIEDADE